MKHYLLISMTCILFLLPGVMGKTQIVDPGADLHISYYPEVHNVLAMVNTPSGVWAACYMTGVWHYSGNKWSLLKSDSTAAKTVTALAVNSDGKIYGSTWMSEGVVQIDAATAAMTIIPWPEKYRKILGREFGRAVDVRCSSLGVMFTTFGGIFLLKLDGTWLLEPKGEPWPLYSDGKGSWYDVTDGLQYRGIAARETKSFCLLIAAPLPASLLHGMLIGQSRIYSFAAERYDYRPLNRKSYIENPDPGESSCVYTHLSRDLSGRIACPARGEAAPVLGGRRPARAVDDQQRRV